jgi:hypothetical protein
MNSTLIDEVPNISEKTAVSRVDDSPQITQSSEFEDAKSIKLSAKQKLLKNILPIGECFFIAFLLGINDGTSS